MEKTTKRSKKFWIILVLVIVLLLLGAFFLFSNRKNTTSVATKGFPETLSMKDSPELDQEKAVTKTITPASDVLWTRAEDGTLYTLTIPEEAIILPSEVTITPFKSVPFNNYSKASYGQGVYISGSFNFIRPTYLTVQLDTALPSDLSNTGARVWGRCTVGSRGYDPEVCAADNKIEFRSGIEPGKVVLFGSVKNKTILLNPTIPTGENNINAMVWNPGYYMADKINAKEAEDLAKMTYLSSQDYINETEVLMHLYKMKGDINQFADRIARFQRSESSYQRETVKGAILAKAIKNEKVASARLDDLFKRRETNFANIRGSFVPMVRFVAFMEQFKKVKTSWFAAIAYADESQLGDYDPNSGGSEGSSDSAPNWWDRLRDYNPFDNNKNPGDDLPDYKPEPEQNGDNLPDYPGDNIPPQDEPDQDWGTPTDEPSSDIQDEINRREEQRRKGEEQRLRDVIGSSRFACNEKYDAIEALFRIGNLSDADLDAIAAVIEKCMDTCQTLGQCEQSGDFGRRIDHKGVIDAANYRILAFLETGADCTATDLKKKDLKTYGKNFCLGSELW